jgi:predicted RNA-binding protein with PUA-like domain
MSYWIIKSDPESYSWEQMKKDKKTFWDGVRNYQARNNLKLMKEGDIALFYLSNSDKALVGEVEIIKEYYQDPTTDDDRWVCVDVRYLCDYKKPLTLEVMKANKGFSEVGLIKQSRLSVMPITIKEYELIKSFVD